MQNRLLTSLSVAMLILGSAQTGFGQPWWHFEYDGSVMPDSTVPHWDHVGTRGDSLMPGGIYRIVDSVTNNPDYWQIDLLLGAEYTYEIRIKLNDLQGGQPLHAVYARNEGMGLNLTLEPNAVHLESNTLDSAVVFATTDDFHTYRVAGNQDSAYLYIDGVLRTVAPNIGDTGSLIAWGSINDDEKSEADWDYIRINNSEWASPICGDANNDGWVDIADGVYLINYIFEGGPAPIDLYNSDVNNDGAVNVGDVVYLVNAIFRFGPLPDCGGKQ